MVGDSYCHCGSGSAHDSFDNTSSEIDVAGDDVGGYMYWNNYIAARVDFEDSTGLLDDGVMAMGWNDEPYI